jgi:NAD(P)-dependent dehydrogenase (short-subunit alcohol dehydrogenase family)
LGLGMHERDLSGKVALVTGASRGIGLETARQLGKLGASVVLGVRNTSTPDETVRQLRSDGLDADSILLDITAKDHRVAANAYLTHRYGKLDILINNAGVWLESENAAQRVPNRTSTLPLGILRETFEVNFFGTVELTQLLLPLMRNSSAGRIVNLSSTMGSLALQADPAYSYYDHKIFAYTASKAALNAFTIVAHELLNTPIKVNSIHPDWVRTEMGGSEADLDLVAGCEKTVRFATLPPEGPTGGFFYLNEPIPW